MKTINMKQQHILKNTNNEDNQDKIVKFSSSSEFKGGGMGIIIDPHILKMEKMQNHLQGLMHHKDLQEVRIV